MLDNVSTLQVVVATLFLMSVFALCLKGAVSGYYVAKLRLRRWRVSQLKKEYAIPTYARLVSSRPQSATTPQTAGRSGPRLTRAGEQSNYSAYVDDGAYTRVVRFPQDVA